MLYHFFAAALLAQLPTLEPIQDWALTQGRIAAIIITGLMGVAVMIAGLAGRSVFALFAVRAVSVAIGGSMVAGAALWFNRLSEAGSSVVG